MAGTIITTYQNRSIDEYIDNRIDYRDTDSMPYWLRNSILTPNTPIINIIMENGIQPKPSNKVLMELYPKLFDGCLEYMKKNKKPTLYIHKEENKPEVWNLFIMNTGGNLLSKRIRSAISAIRKKRQNKFVYVESTNGTTNRYGSSEVSSIRYYCNMTFYRFKQPELIGETELPF